MDAERVITDKDTKRERRPEKTFRLLGFC